MSYLIINENENLLISKLGESIYSKSYSKHKQSKTLVLGKSKYDEYCCSIDVNNSVNIIYKTNTNSLVHLKGKDGSFTTSTILEDEGNKYNINNIQLVSRESSYLFYCAKTPNEDKYDLIFHTISDDSNVSPQSLITLPALGTKYICEIYSNTLYLLTLIKNNSIYELNCYTYHIPTNSWLGYESIVTSDLPITDYSFFIANNELHITYVIENYGYMSLYYYTYIENGPESTLNHHKKSNPDEGIRSLKIFTSGTKISAKIFSYKNIHWINVFNSHQLYFSFSSNNGQSFTEAKRCTLQHEEISEINVLHKALDLSGREFFGYITNHPNIAILSQIDLDNLLSMSPLNIELKEVMSTQKMLENQTTYIRELECEVKLLQQNQEKIIEQYNQLSEFTKSVQSEGKKWRNKYNNASAKLPERKPKKNNTTSVGSEMIMNNLDAIDATKADLTNQPTQKTPPPADAPKSTKVDTEIIFIDRNETDHKSENATINIAETTKNQQEPTKEKVASKEIINLDNNFSDLDTEIDKTESDYTEINSIVSNTEETAIEQVNSLEANSPSDINKDIQ